MQVRKPARIRPQRYPAQEKQGRESLALALAEHRLKTVDPTFSHEPTNHDAIVRMLQRRRIAIPVLMQLLDSSDPIIRELIKNRFLEIKPAVLAKFIGLAEIKKLIDNPDSEIRSIASKSLVNIYLNMGEAGSSGLQELLYNINYAVRSAAAESLSDFYFHMGKKGMLKLQQLVRDSAPTFGYYAAKSLVKFYLNMGDRGLPALKELSSHKSSDISYIALKSLIKLYSNQGDRGLPGLKELSSYPNGLVRSAAVEALAKLYLSQGERGLPGLQELLSHSNKMVNSVVVKALTQLYLNLGKRGSSGLQELLSHTEPRIKYFATISLIEYYSNMGVSSIPKLEQLLIRTDDTSLQEIISNALAKLKSRPLLLGDKSPLHATGYLPEVVKHISELQSISRELTEEFKDKFVGVVIFGSISKGYATPNSDVDYAIIGSDQKVSERFKTLSEKKRLPLCADHYVTEHEANLDLLSSLYYGLFIGDRKKLQQMQKKVFSKLNKEQWDEIRMKIYHEESELSKAFNRVKLGFREKQRILAATALRVPPKYEEMRKSYGL